MLFEIAWTLRTAYDVPREKVLEQAVTDGRRLVADAEVLKDILHRYVAMGRKDAIRLAVMQRHGIRMLGVIMTVPQ